VLFGIAAIAAIGVLIWLNFRAQRDARMRIVRSVVELRRVNDVLSAMKDAETGERGFLLTGLESYLEPYDTAIAGIGRQLESLRQDTASQFDLREDAARLETAVSAKLKEL